MPDSFKDRRRVNSGFTLVELIVVIPMVILLIGSVIGIMVQTARDAAIIKTKNSLVYNIQDALNRIENDVELSTRFLATTDTALDISSPQGPNNSAQDFQNIGDNGTALLLQVPLTDKNPADSSRGLVYLSNQPNACGSANVNSNQFMQGVIAYFVHDNTLWRRVIMPSDYAAAGCSTPWQQPSCAPGASASFCKAEDIKLISGISSGDFNVSYLTDAAAESPITDASNPSLSDAARQEALDTIATVHIQISAQDRNAGEDVSQTLEGYSTKLATFNPDEVGSGPTAPTIYASDDFTGTNGSGWSASKWALGINPSGSGSSATLNSNRGRLVSGSGSDWSSGATITRRLVMDQVADVDVVGTFELGSTRNLAYIHVRATSNANWGAGYGLYIDRDGFDLDCAGSCSSSVDDPWTNFPMSVGTKYKFRFNVVGNRIRVKMWAAANSEPASWMYDQTDTANSAPNPGYVGVMLTSGSNDVFYLDDIEVRAP